MFFLPSFLMKSPADRARDAKAYAERVERRCSLAVPWDPAMKWQPELTVQAHTYTPRMLFESTPTRKVDVNTCDDEEKVLSPSGAWLYCTKRLKRGEVLLTYNGARKGNVMFDGEVLIPCLYDKGYGGRWNEAPFMSLTPMEMLTLRWGTRLAKGRTVVAGLGLGHQLIEVSHRKKVGDLVLVEQSQELVDWILPRIAPHLGRPLTDVIVGDAYVELPKLHADVAVVDIFPNYGNNDFEQDKLRGRCRNIKHVWCWGAASIA